MAKAVRIFDVRNQRGQGFVLVLAPAQGVDAGGWGGCNKKRVLSERPFAKCGYCLELKCKNEFWLQEN